MKRVCCLLSILALVSGCIMSQAGWANDKGRESELTVGNSSGGGLFGSSGGVPEAPRRAGELQPEQDPLLTAVNPRKVVYTGDFAVVVADVPQSVSATKALAERLGGYMQAMGQTMITIRVPAEKFDQAVSEIERMGTVMGRDVQAKDVTEVHVDLDIRLKNAKALLERLQDLLTKAKDVKEALEVERELARVRTEIEQLEGQLKRLNSQISFASISVSFLAVEKAPVEMKVRLPFWWLKTLGLDSLTHFPSP